MTASKPVTPTRPANLSTRVRARLRAVPASRWVTLVALAMIAAQVSVRGVWVSQSWFYSDDFLFLGDIGHGDDDLAWYFRFHFSHFMPLSFVLVKMVTWFGAFNWGAAATQIIVLQLLASLAAWWMLRAVFGNRPGILFPLAFYLFTAMTIPSVMWWAVAINQLPHQVAAFGAIGMHVLYLRHHRTRHLVLTAAFLLLGYGTYTKTMLLPIVLLMITLIYFAEGRVGRRIATTVRRDWVAWLVHGLMLAVYVIAYVLRQPPSDPVGLTGNPIGFGLDTITLGFVPALVGGPLEWVTWTSPVTVVVPSNLLVVLSYLLVVATVAYLALTRTRVLRALLIPAVYLAISIGLIYVGRFYIINFIGTFHISRHMQYLADTAVIVTLTAGLMTMRVPDSVQCSERRSTPLWTIRPHRAVLAAIGGLIVIGYLVSSSRYAQPWTTQFAQRDFFQRAIPALDEHRPQLADAPLPPNGMSPFLFPRNLPGIAFSPVREMFTLRTVGNDLQLFKDDATLAYAKVDGPVRTERPTTEPCAYRVDGSPTRIAVVPVVNYPLWIGIDYVADEVGQVTVEFGNHRVDAPLEAGRHTLFIAASDDYSSIRFSPLPDQQICVSAIRVGGLTTQDQP